MSWRRTSWLWDEYKPAGHDQVSINVSLRWVRNKPTQKHLTHRDLKWKTQFPRTQVFTFSLLHVCALLLHSRYQFPVHPPCCGWHVHSYSWPLLIHRSAVRAHTELYRVGRVRLISAWVSQHSGDASTRIKNPSLTTQKDTTFMVRLRFEVWSLLSWV